MVLKRIIDPFVLLYVNVYAEETGDLQKPSLETTSTTNVSIEEDVQTNETVNDLPQQVTETPAKPKYR